MNWLVIKTDSMAEMKIARQLERAGLTWVMPVKLNSHAVSRHTKIRRITESPVMSRRVFVMAAHETELPELRHSRGLDRDASGRAWSIPAAAMSEFLKSHSAWLENERNRLSPKPKVKGDKPVTLTSFAQLQEHLNKLAGKGDVVDPATGEILDDAA